MRCLIRLRGHGPGAMVSGATGGGGLRRAWSCSKDHKNTADYPSSSHVGDKGDSAEGPGPRTQDPGPVVEDERTNPNPGQTNTQRCSGVGALDEDSNFSPTSLITRDRRVPSATGTTQERTCGASALPGYWRRSR